jgi:hypothetical protein
MSFLPRYLSCIIFFIIFIISNASAKTVIIGKGSGVVSKTSMSGLNPGDVLAIRAGTYKGGGSFGGLHDITIINYKGTVTFGGTIDFGNSSNMKNIRWTGTGVSSIFYGFVFNGAGNFGPGPLGYPSGDAFMFTALHNESLRFDHISFQNLASNAFETSHYPIRFVGTIATMKIYKMTISDCRIDNSGELFQGDYGTLSPKNNENLCDSVDMHNIIVTQIRSPGSVVQGPFTHANFYNWSITYIGYNKQPGDVGVFDFSGNGQVHHNYMHGGRGYLARIYGCSIKPAVDDVWCYDNIILATSNYAGFDVRNDTVYYGIANPYIGKANIHIVSNTVGNKGNDEDYNAPVVVMGALNQGAFGEVRNNIGFNLNTPRIPSQAIVVSYIKGWPKYTDTSNNKYYTASAILTVLADTNNLCALKPGSPLIGTGKYFQNITTDYNKRARPIHPSIGAQEYAAPQK